MSDAIRVVVVDDHPVFREGFAALLRSIPDIEVLGRPLGEEAVEAVDTHRPAVVVMDVQMPGMDGVEATRRVVAAYPETGVVVLTMSEEDATLLDAVRAGARGYLLKGAEPDEIVRAITTVAAGGVVFGAVLAAPHRRVLRPPRSAEAGPFPELSAREREVLDLSRRPTNGDIASRLFLSPKTVRNHVYAVFAKIQAPTGPRPSSGPRDAGLGR